MTTYVKKYQDLLGLKQFPKLLTTLVKETRLSLEKTKTPFQELTLIDSLVQVTATPIPTLPGNSPKEYPLHLLRPPIVSVKETGFTLALRPDTLFSHSNISGESSPDIREFISDNLYVLEKILVPLPDPSKPNQPPEIPKKLSHAIMLGLDHTMEFPISFMVITMGRKNGPSNLVSLRYRNMEGDLVVTSTEKLFQAGKAAHIKNMDKVLEILNADNGLKAKIMAGAKNLPMLAEERASWDEVALQKLLEAKMCCLGDQTFFNWFEELYAFTKTHQIPEILFLEVGEKDELQYTCGMMGDVVMDQLKDGEYVSLYNQFGPLQVVSGDKTTMWNSAGVMMMKLFSFFKEAHDQGITCEDWQELMNLETLFPLEIKSDSPVGMKRTFSMAL